jgi:predicted nucleic acid-binding protein
MRLVVDANVIIQLGLAGGSLGPLTGHELVAPPLLASEFTSSLSELAYRGDVPIEAAQRVMTTLATVPIRYERPAGLYERAWDLARQLGWAKTYEAEYVALAELTATPLVTLDARLRRGAGHLVEIPLLTDLEPAT